ncbi:MAG: hypothetical protein J7L73_07445 [Anaerolineales bacterium]|nr:hypothetical protein [Anaerolineales bacterium]
MKSELRKIFRRYWWLLLGVFPLIIVGLYGTLINVHLLSRYNDAYFTDEYLQKYNAPGPVALAIEEALQTGNNELFTELAGLHRGFNIEPNPNIIFTILLDVDDRGYFHYLYLDMKTYRRSTYYVKQVKERWVVVPEDLYFYWDSGFWWDVYLPLALVWWGILIVVWVTIFVYRLGAKTRESMHGGG